MDNKHFYCIILAGGKGRRLWPTSRETYPKQFIDFFGTGRTLLQQTYDRFSLFIAKENIYVSTNVEYESIVREQLPELAARNILSEPIHRNTAPSLAWASHRIRRIDPDACLVVTPSDHLVMGEAAFSRNVLQGLEFVANNDAFLTMGVKPTRPEPGYGYIQLGDFRADNVSRVKTFTEKPDREFARLFMESGEFLWNTGLFLTNVKKAHQVFSVFMPNVLRRFDQEHPDHTIEEENTFMRDRFSAYPNLSIEHGILERTENVFVLICDFGWADIGTWHGVYEAMQKSADDNVVIDSNVMLDNSHCNVVKLDKDMLAVINGLDGYIVVQHGNVLLICKKEDSSALVRKFVNDVQVHKGEKFV